jgi:hypothetical protein
MRDHKGAIVSLQECLEKSISKAIEPHRFERFRIDLRTVSPSGPSAL